MEGEGMVAVVRGLRDAGLAVTLLDGNRQYTLMPNSISQVGNPRGPVANSNASTQQSPPKCTAESSTDSSLLQCDRDAQAVDGRYTSIYKTMHCNVRPTSPPIQLTEFPPQRPDVHHGHGNFQVGGTGSGATNSPIRATSPSNSFRGAMSWPDRGSVCAPRPSYEADAFANSLRKYPCLSPDRSSEVMERLVSYTQAKGVSKTMPRNQSSPPRYYEQTSHHSIESKANYTRATRSYEPEVTIRSKKNEDAPTRERRTEFHERIPRSFDVRCVKDMSKRLRDSVKASTYPYNHPVCPTIKESHDYTAAYGTQLQNSTNSVNMEIQAAVKMISKEVATVQRDFLTRKNMAAPNSPVSSVGEDNVEGECYFVPSLETNTSLKSIQTTFCFSDVNLRARKSVQTVCSTIDLNRKHTKLIVSRKSKSQEEIKVTNDDLKRSLLELIEEVSNAEKSKNIIRDELIQKLFDAERDNIKPESANIKHNKCHKYVSTFCPSGCDYVGDFQELVGKLRHCYGDSKQILQSEIKPFRAAEYRQLDFVLKDWINSFNLSTKDLGKYADRAEILSSVEDKIKLLFKNRTKQDFDLKTAIVKILEEIPMEVNKSYKKRIYLHKLVDVLLKRMKNVVMGQYETRVRKKVAVNRYKKILTEDDIRDFLRTRILDLFNELNLEVTSDMLDDLENELIDVMIDSIDCIRCGHVDEASEEMQLIFQDLSQLTNKQANYITPIILQDFHDILNNCNFSQTYMILHSNVNNSRQSTIVTNDTDFSIGAITEADHNANLDQYTNQLCQRINEWLDGLSLPQIHDRGFREVVVNDLAGDIIDRNKYIELNPDFKGTQEDELEVLKYQIFKWVNKLVGEENQETIGNASQLMMKIKSIPVPMLTNPQGRRMDDSSQGKKPFDEMRPCLGETCPNTCAQEILKFRVSPKVSYCFKQPQEKSCCKTSSGRCCNRVNCKNRAKNTQPELAEAQAGQAIPPSKDPQSQAAQGSQGQSGSLPPSSPKPTGKAPATEATTEQASTSQAPTEQKPTGKWSTGQPRTGTAGWTPTDQTPIAHTPTGQISKGSTPGQSPRSQTPTRQTPTSQAYSGPASKGYTPTGQTPKGRESPYAKTAQGANIHPGTYSPREQGSPYSQALQSSPAYPGSYSSAGQPGPPSQVPQAVPGGPGHPGAYSPAGLFSPYSQSPLGGPGYPSSYTPVGQIPATKIPTGLYSGQQIPQVGPVPPGSYSPASHISPHSQASQGSPAYLRSFTPTVQVTPHSLVSQGVQGRTGFFSPADQSSQIPQGTIEPSGQGFSTIVPQAQFPSHAQGSPGYFQSPQSGKVSYNQGQSFGPPYSQGSPMLRSQEPNQQWSSPTAFPPGLANSTLLDPNFNFTQPSARPASGRMSPDGMSGPRYPSTGQSTYDTSHSMYGTRLDGMTPQGFAMAPDPMRGNAPLSSSYDQSLQMAGPSRSAYKDSSAPVPPSLKRINDDYDEYLRQWVQQIPLNVSDEQSAEKARLGVYNGIWKGVTKMKLDPDIFNDPYNYQDVFDEEIEGLFKKLPKTNELEASKETLKAQLLHKTMGMNAQIRSTNAPATYKQQLIEAIEYNLPKRTHTVNEADPIQQQEEVDKIKIAEYYILYTRFKGEDSLKANVNQKSFLKNLGELLNTIRNTNGIDIEPNAYANEIINSLDKVPVPNMSYMRDEADDILLGFEVENWISDLPSRPDYTLPLEKRRIRDAITKKIQDLGSNVSYADSSFATVLKTEMVKFLEKLPIQPGTDINFIIEELANRIRNLSKYIRPKSVSFDDQLGYDEFSRNMPAASSFNELTGPKSWGSQGHRPEDDTWHSLQTTMPSPALLNWSGQQNMSTKRPCDSCSAQPVAVHRIGPRSDGKKRGVHNTQTSPESRASSGLVCCDNADCTRSHTFSKGPRGPYSQTVPQGQVPSGTYNQIPYNQGFGIPPASQVMPNVQGSSGGKFQSVAPSSQVTQGSYEQGRVGPYNQNFGSTSMPFTQGTQNIHTGPTPMVQNYSQVPQSPYDHGFQDQSLGPPPYGPSSPEFQGQVPQGLNFTHPTQATLGQNATQPGQNLQGQSAAYSGQDTRGPTEYIGQAPQGLNATHHEQSPYGPNFAHSSQIAQEPNASHPNYIAESFGTTYPSPIPHVTYGQTLPDAQGYVQPGYFGQPIPHGPPGYYQDDTKGQISYSDASAEVNSSMQAWRQNQTAQSFGPVSAASQVPDRTDLSWKPQQAYGMAESGLGSMETGPSAQDLPLSLSNRGTGRKEKLEKEPEATMRSFDINQKDIFNIKSVQTAFSSIDIKTTKCKYCEIRSKSQEELTKITKKQEVIKRKDLGRGDLQQNVTEWFEIHSDKVKVKLWGEKMQKLAEKLKKPGGEEKLRMKIEKFLKKVPDQFSEGDDDRLEYRKQIPNDIIRKLKKMYSNPPQSSLSVYRLELSKYGSRYKMENFRKVVMNWVKSLNIKKKDFLGRHVKKEEVFKYIADKLEPLVLDRPKSDLEYKISLKCNIRDFINDLPLAVSSQDKDCYVNQVTEALINEILLIESKAPSTYIQPTIKEIKEFVKDEITFFLEKSRVAISTKRMQYLETELVDLLLDLTDIVDIDHYVEEDITTILKEIGKLPEYKAKYFTNLLLRDYKEFFFRESFFNEKGKSDHLPATYSVFQNGIGMVDLNVATNFDVYKQRLVEEITKWLSKVNTAAKNENMELIVKDLATNIVDRHRYLVLNPNIKDADTERTEHLKYQIFKWMDKFFGTENTAVLENADELLDIVNNIPKPLLAETSNEQSVSPQNTETNNDTKLFIEILTQEIYDWFHELPMDLQMTQDGRLNTQLIKNLAEAIEKGLDKKNPEVIAKEVGRWAEKVFDTKLNKSDIEKLKYRIRSVPYPNENVDKDPKQEKVLIRSYEDIIDEWIDSISIELKKEDIFVNNRNEFIHELAVKICHIKSRLNHLQVEAIENKLKDKILTWMKKLPMKDDKQNNRDIYAAKLVQIIQEHDAKDSTDRQSVQTNQESGIDQLESVIFEWLKKNINLQNEEYHEEIMKEMANKIDSAICNRLSYPYEDIKQCIRMLGPEQSDEFVGNMALQLKFYLQEFNMFGDMCLPVSEDETLISNIDVWLNNLPLAVADIDHFESQKIDFIESIMRINTPDINKAVLKKEILTFMNSLPMDRYKKSDKRYLDEEASKLLLSLMVEHTNVPNKDPLKTNIIVKNSIRDWTNTLPLKYVYCPRELRSFIDDMSSVITALLFDPDHRIIEQNDARLQKEITKFLRRFPLEEEYSTESEISQMAAELTKTLKDIYLLKETNKSSVKSLTVYDLSLEHSNITDNDFSIRSIQETDINANLNTYTRQLVKQIGMWFDTLNLPNTHKEGFKEVVINDLAGDIVDRHKYLELNPDRKGSKEDELEHLKYQIFKWINKLVGEENFETIAHAEDLMQRVQGIPVPMLLKPLDKHQTLQSSSGDKSQQKNVSQPSNTGNKSSLLQNEIPTLPIGELSLRESLQTLKTPPGTSTGSFNISGSVASSTPKPTNCCTRELPPALPPPEEGTKEDIYDKYQKIFREKCNALPIDTSTPENAKLAELAKTGIYNGIVKTFFKLKADPDIENDYGYFEFMLEEKIEDMLDILPQTEDLKNKRHAWKLDILTNAIDMLDQLHTLSDRPSFRQRVRNKFNRKFAKDLELEECFLLQQGFLAEVADAYILETNYKEKDPIKANVYRNRLMKKVDDLANHLAKEHNVGFRFFKKAQLARMAVKVLEQVPIPDNDILQSEAEEIQLADEVERWYKELPTKPFVNDTDAVLRKRMIDLLAKKLYEIHKNVTDTSKESKMKHEMSQFLEKRAKLQQDQDLNINFMVDQLNNRLKNNWLNIPLNYSTFEKEKPLSSTFAQVDNHDFLAPLMDAAINTVPMRGQGYQEPVNQSVFKSSHIGENYGYFAQPGQSMSPNANYERNGNKSLTGPSQTYASNSRQEAAQGGMSRQIPSHNMATNTKPVLHGTGIALSHQVGPSDTYVSHGGASPRSMQGPQMGSSQVGPKLQQSPIASQSPRSNMSQPHSSQFGSQVGTGQVFIGQQSPQMQSMGYTTLPKNMTGVSRTNGDTSSARMQNIDPSGLFEPRYVAHMGPQRTFFDPNMSGSYAGQDQVSFTKHPSQRMSPTDISEYPGDSGIGPSSGGMDVMEGDYPVRCKCFEAYRRRRRCFDYDYDRCSRFRPYKCPY